MFEEARRDLDARSFGILMPCDYRGRTTMLRTLVEHERRAVYSTLWVFVCRGFATRTGGCEEEDAVNSSLLQCHIVEQLARAYTRHGESASIHRVLHAIIETR